MATWKKVIVSGSSAELASLTASGNITAAAYYGDGSNLTGVSATSLDIDAFGSDLTAITVAGTDKLALSDAGTEGRINVSQLATPLAGTGLEANSGTVRIAAAAAGAGLTGGSGSALAVGAGTHITVNADDVAVNTTSLIPAISGSIFTTVSGDITITAAGVAAIQANSVALGTDTTGNYVATIANATNGGLTVNNSGTETAAVTIAANLNDLTAATVDVANDSIAIIDATDNSTKKESVADLVSGIAGTNLTASSGQLSLATTISGNPTFSGNVTVSGDLTINGSTTTVNTTNVLIEDRFVILNYGSGSAAPAGEGGIIIEGSTPGQGEAFFYDETKGRWGVASAVSSTATSVTQAASVALVYEGTTSNATSAGYNDNGNIAIDSGEIYIYS
jgi:hypothetical protein